MREKEMKRLMQQDLVVPQKVHDAFEKGIQQIAQGDMELEKTENWGEEMRGTEQKAGQRKGGKLWGRIGLAAATAAAVLVIAFHSQIYSFAKSLFIHDMITVGEKENVQEEDVRIIKIKDGVLTNDWEEGNYFESLEDLGGKLGISFLKSTAENDVTGKGRVLARMSDYGEVTVDDSLFSVKDVSEISYTEEGQMHCHLDSNDAYVISCGITFYTKQFQDDYGIDYENAAVVEDYETKNGFHATIIQYKRADGYKAILYHDNIRYEYNIDHNVEAQPKVDDAHAMEDFRAFLDTLTA